MNIKLIIKNLCKFLLCKFNLILKFFGCRLIVQAKKNSTNYLEIQNKFSLMALADSNGVLHLGGHKGEEAVIYHWLGKKVIWIEAIPKIFDQLKNNLFFYSNQKAYNVLLGDMDDIKKSFFISNNDSLSSSLFKFSQKTLDGIYHPGVNLKTQDEIILEMSKLDTFIKKNNIDISNYNHWVVDLQGAELIALKGAENALKFCNSLLIEISKVDIYENGVLWPELKNWLIERGFYPVTQPLTDHTDVLFKKQN